ncbi:MAG: MFS transporter [Hyphomicrobiaceae bacterium]
MSRPRLLPSLLARRLPFFYGWVVLGCACCAGFARQGPAVATLSIFIAPMAAELDWSKTAISGAVSLGGVLAAITAPYLGGLLDRHGARAILVVAILTTGLAMMGLSLVMTLPVFYVLFCIGRMNFAGPFDLGIYGSINAWFIAKRPTATAIATTFQMIGLTAMPLIATAAMLWFDDWRLAWVAVGLTVLIVGLLPNWLLMVRRPEDMGLLPDGRKLPDAEADPGSDVDGAPASDVAEATFTRAEALRTPTFWLLCLFTLLVYPVQAGISLHQAPHLLERNFDLTIAATVVGTFSVLSAVSGLLYGAVARRLPIWLLLASIGACLSGSAIMMVYLETALEAYASAALFGFAIGGLLTMLPLAWADFFGRRSFGAIRGAALSVQVVAQAIGPVLSGGFRDLTGDYVLSLWVLAALAAAGSLVALFLRAPKPPPQRGPDAGST